MSLLNKTTFDTTYANPSGQFITNPDGLIEADRLRAFAKDVNESTPVIGVTSLAGLKAIGTTNLSAGMVAIFREETSQKGRIYQLRTGAIAEASPITLRPNDYAVSTNEKYWQLAGGIGGYEKTSAPTASDDAAAGYASGDIWVHTTPAIRQIYVCSSNVTGAAVWVGVAAIVPTPQTLAVSTGTEALAIAANTDVVEISLTANWTPATITGLTKGKIIALRIATDGLATYPYQINWPSNISFNDGVEPELSNNDAAKYDWIFLMGIDDSNNGQVKDTMLAG
jgi:hypothetical protein